VNNKKVLIIRLSALGDVIFNLPLANILQKNGYEVHWITSEKGFDIINNNPLVDKAILAPMEKWKKHNFFTNFFEYIKIIRFLRSQKYDIAIDTQLLLKSAVWTAFCGAKRRIVSKSAREFANFAGNEVIEELSYDYKTHATKRYLKFSEHLGLKSDEIIAKLPPSTQKSIDKINELTKDLDNSKPIIGIAPATTWTTKHWNKDNWKRLIKEIEKDYTLVFTGTKKDQDLIKYISEDNHLSLAGKTNLLELAEFFKRCDLVISLDSGSTHLAWACEKPKIISIFCSTPAGFYAPCGTDDKYIALSGNLSCQPCHGKVCCLKENINACTNHPSVQDVLSAVNKLLKN
jgi:heptosyltransferase-1